MAESKFSGSANSLAPGVTNPNVPAQNNVRARAEKILEQSGAVPEDPNAKPSFFQGLRSVSLKELFEVHQIPCARDGFLFGLGAGFGVGGLVFVLTAHPWRMMNWFTGTWAAGSLGAYHYCKKRKEEEGFGMKRAREIMAAKRKEKDSDFEKARAEMRERKKEAHRKEMERVSRYGANWRDMFRANEARSPEEQKKIQEQLKRWEEEKRTGKMPVDAWYESRWGAWLKPGDLKWRDQLAKAEAELIPGQGVVVGGEGSYKREG